MSVLSDMQTAMATPAMKANQGESFEYTPIGGVARTITGIVFLASELLRDESNHETKVSLAKCLVDRNNATGVLSPSLGDSISWNGSTWDFHQSAGLHGNTWELWFTETEVQQYGKKPSQL